MKKLTTSFVLIFEVIIICVLHAIKIHQAAPAEHNATNRQLTPHQKDVFLRQMAFND